MMTPLWLIPLDWAPGDDDVGRHALEARTLSLYRKSCFLDKESSSEQQQQKNANGAQYRSELYLAAAAVARKVQRPVRAVNATA